MNLAAWILGLFWSGLLLVAIVSWAVNRTFGQLNELKIELSRDVSPYQELLEDGDDN